MKSAHATPNKVKIGIIGAGNIATQHYNGYLTAGAEVVGFVEPVEATRIKRSKEWGIPGFASTKAMFETLELTAVSICTPNAYHHEATLAAAKRGLHVLCEKPLSLSLEQARAMVDAAATAGIVLQVGHHLRSSLYVEQAKAIIDSGAIGRIAFIRLRQAHDWGGLKELNPNFATLERAGGGTLLDNGCHMMDLARHLGGEVAEVFARTATLGFEIEVEDTSLVSLKFDSGAIGSVENAWTATGWEEGFWIYGSAGALECTNRSSETTLRHVFRASRNTSWHLPDEAIYRFQAAGGHAREVAHFLASIRDARPVICSGEDGLKAVELILAAYESARKGQAIPL